MNACRHASAPALGLIESRPPLVSLIPFRGESVGHDPPATCRCALSPAVDGGETAFYCVCWLQDGCSAVPSPSTPTPSTLALSQLHVLGAAGFAACTSAARGLQRWERPALAPDTAPLAREWDVVLLALDAAESVAPSLWSVKWLVCLVQQMMRLSVSSSPPALALLTGGSQAASTAGCVPAAAP